MAAIVLGLCCVSSMIGGGYLAYNEMQKSQLEEEIKQREETFTKTPGLHMFSECNYVGNSVFQATGDNLPKTAEDEIVIDISDGFKSFIITSGYKVDTYDKEGLTGVKMTYTGPTKMKCLTTPIKGLKFYKA
jgi:hypothetical protein